jgi:Zn-dependent protease/predicted transcriptional regulator
MEQNMRLGRIAGIGVGINWSVIVIAVLVTWVLASQTLPETYPDHATGAYWATAVAASMVFFLSLLAHEVGHALVARRYGVETHDITLWMLGGVAHLKGEAARPVEALRISVAGPLVSFSLGTAFLMIAAGLAVVGAPELVVAGPTWLAVVNLMLGTFNLLPAFPLDGGRVLQAVLWMQWDDRLRATRRAAAVGRGFGYGLVTLGILAALGGAGISGLWLAIIGLFVGFASTAEAEQTELTVLLGGVRTRDIMTPDPITVSPALSVQALLDDVVLRTHVSAFPVVDDHGAVLGLVTLHEVRGVPAAARASTPVLAAAVPIDRVLVTTPDVPVTELVAAISRPGTRALVVEDGRLVGIVSTTDVTRALEVRGLSRPAEPQPGTIPVEPTPH